MSATKQQANTTATDEVSSSSEVSLLDSVVSVTKNTERTRAESLLRAFTEEALKGTVTWSRNLTETINHAIAAIDKKLTSQVSEIMHQEKFSKLEGAWRGIHYFVSNSLTGPDLKVRFLNINKKTLKKDLFKALDFDQSELFKKVYENEFGTPGGEPYSVLIGDYEFENHPEDIELLGKISEVAASSFAPFISAAGEKMFGLDKWADLSKPRDLEKVFQSLEYAKWRGFRDSEDSRFVTLTMPRVLSRLPYGANTKPVEEFDFEEVELDKDGKTAKVVDHDKYCWMNSAYVMATRITSAYSEFGWCTAIRGAEGGGKVENLPSHVFTSDDGSKDLKCPTEVGITDRREAELSKMGFLPLCHYKNTDYAVFFGGQTTQQPKEYDDIDATETAAISARLPVIMATSRFAHYLKVMARDKIGSFASTTELQTWLQQWIKDYVNTNEASSQVLKSRFPLAEAKVEVKEIPGKPGAYNAVAWLKPWLQLEELNTSIRMVAKIPEKS